MSNLYLVEALSYPVTICLPRSAPRLCEFMLVEYGTSVMSLESMWQVAMDYLSHCPTHGQHYMQLLVERIPLTSERKADKVIHLCQHYHLKEQGEGGVGGVSGGMRNIWSLLRGPVLYNCTGE